MTNVTAVRFTLLVLRLYTNEEYLEEEFELCQTKNFTLNEFVEKSEFLVSLKVKRWLMMELFGKICKLMWGYVGHGHPWS